VYALGFAPAIANCNEGWRGKFNNAHEACLLGEGCKLSISVRGKNYIITGNDEINEKLNNCAVTFWGGAHFLLYSFIGFLCPDLFWQTFIIGVAFEFYEYKKFDCHDTLDILLNTSGFLFGRTINNLIIKKKPSYKRPVSQPTSQLESLFI